MKIPDKNDPGGDKEGQLPRDIVLQTLTTNGVSVQHLGGGMYRLAQSNVVEYQRFQEFIGGLMVRRLSKKFKIDGIEFYYDPVTGKRKYQE